jgi:transposase
MQEVIPVSKRSPYSATDVKGVDVGAVAGKLEGSRCVVGVDVGKRELMACVYSAGRQFERPWRVQAPGEVRLLVEKLLELKGRVGLVVAMESSGTYGDALRQALADAGVEVWRVSGVAVKGHAEGFDGVPSQHDGKDAAVMAELCWEGHAKRWDWSPAGESDQALGYWVRRLDRAQRIKQIAAGKLEALMAKYWPEASGLLEASGATLPGALHRWGSPGELGSDPRAAEVLAGLGGHYLKPAKIAAVVASARQSVGVRMSRWERREVQEIAELVLAQRREMRWCKRELRELSKGYPAILAQEPAVGLVAACVLWVCLGDVRDYPSAGAYRKAMGLNLTEWSSGQFKGPLRLSKRGHRLTRKWVYFAALRWMRHAAVKRWVERKKQRDGGKGKKAAVAVMRRLVLGAWHAGYHGVAFAPERLFPGLAPRRRTRG